MKVELLSHWAPLLFVIIAGRIVPPSPLHLLHTGQLSLWDRHSTLRHVCVYGAASKAVDGDMQSSPFRVLLLVAG